MNNWNRLEIFDLVSNKIKDLIGIENSLDPNEDLLELGLHSMKSIQLIVDIEETFGIEFDDEELLFDNFSTIKKIIERIEDKI